MKKMPHFIIIFWLWLIMSMVTAIATPTPAPQWPTPVPMTNDGAVPAGRTDASMVLHYDTWSGMSSNAVYLYGGKGKNEADEDIFVDLQGEIHSTQFVRTDNTQESICRWRKNQTDPFYLSNACEGSLQSASDYPPAGRFGHAALIIPTIEGKILHHYEELGSRENEMINYLVFGGYRQITRTDELVLYNMEIINELYVNAEYAIDTENPVDRRNHWYKISPSPSEVWPGVRAYHQMVPLFSEETIAEGGTYPFLVFGGLNSISNIHNDGFIGTFSRELTPEDPGVQNYNEWNFDMCIDVTFEEIPGTDQHDAFRVFGAGVVYDPYYGTDGQGNRMPRVIIAGGTRALGDPSLDPVGYRVICMYPTFVSEEYDWTSPRFEYLELPDLPDLTSEGASRLFCTAVLNPRDHTLRIIGGETRSGDPNPGILQLDLTNPSSGWQLLCEDFEAVRPLAVYSNGTRILTSDDGEPVMHWDQAEATLEPPENPFVWEVSEDAPYGLNNLNTILNTPRLHSWDIVRIHQTRSTTGQVNDCFKTCAAVPPWLSDITLEGIVENGFKPVIYTRYSDNSALPVYCTPHYSKLGIAVYCGAPMTIRNIAFCQSDTDLSPTDPLPTAIPTAVIAKYLDEDSRDIPDALEYVLKTYETDLDETDDIWDLARHHNDDPMLWIHSPIQIDNCRFTTTGLGMTLICVSSAIRQAHIRRSVFENNFIGILALEKEHLLTNNEFYDNYLAGIAFDKGSRAICRDSLFTGNGRLEVMEDLQGGIMAHYCVTDGVPRIMTPWIHNNTFAGNYRAMAITEPVYRRQFMNRPFFFQNIVSQSEESIVLDSLAGRCGWIGMANCFDPAGSVPPIETDQAFLSAWDQGIDPIFVTGSDYALSPSSPCLNAGLTTLDPGVMSELNYPDYGTLDIGFHQLPGTGTVPGSPCNPEIVDEVLYWDEQAPYPTGYLVMIEADGYGFIFAEYIDSGTEFDFSVQAAVYDHLYLWVMSHNLRRVYSEPVMIEWLDE